MPSRGEALFVAAAVCYGIDGAVVSYGELCVALAPWLPEAPPPWWAKSIGRVLAFQTWRELYDAGRQPEELWFDLSSSTQEEAAELFAALAPVAQIPAARRRSGRRAFAHRLTKRERQIRPLFEKYRAAHPGLLRAQVRDMVVRDLFIPEFDALVARRRIDRPAWAGQGLAKARRRVDYVLSITEAVRAPVQTAIAQADYTKRRAAWHDLGQALDAIRQVDDGGASAW